MRKKGDVIQIFRIFNGIEKVDIGAVYSQRDPNRAVEHVHEEGFVAESKHHDLEFLGDRRGGFS